MPSSEEIADQQELLATYRQTLAGYLKQKALLGAPYCTPAVLNGICEARDNIRRIKDTLSKWGVTVDGHPNDEEYRDGIVSTGRAPRYDIVAIRNLLLAAFDDKEFEAFCSDRFRAVYEKLASETGRLIKIQFLLNYCESSGQLDKLLVEVGKMKPVQYAAFIGSVFRPQEPSRKTIIAISSGNSEIEITFKGDFSDFTPELKQVIIDALAAVLNVARDQIGVVGVRSGSIIVRIEVPAEVADRLIALFEAGDSVVQDLGIEYVRVIRRAAQAVLPSSTSDLFEAGDPVVQDLGIEHVRVIRRAAQAVLPYSTSDSVFATFERKQRSRSLKRIRAETIFADMLLLPEVNLNEAEEVVREAIGEVLPNAFGRAIERQVLASFQYHARLCGLVPIEPERLRQLVVDWHSFLDQAVAPDAATARAPRKYILTAFSLIEDYIITLTQNTLDTLVKDVAKREGKQKADVLREARRRAIVGENKRGGKLDREIWDAIDILALIIVLMKRAGLKPTVMDAGLQAWLVDCFGAGSPTMGGAAGNEAYILRALDVPVLVHAPYNHTSQSNAAPDGAKRLVFETTRPVIPFPALENGNPEDARRLSFVLQLTTEPDHSPTLVVDGQMIRPQLTDRIILRIPNPRTDRPAKWRTLRVIWKGARGQFNPVEPTAADRSTLIWDVEAERWILEIKRDEVFKDFLDNDWPYLPIFQHHPIVEADGTLTIELASADELEGIAGDVRAVLLGAIQMLGRTLCTETLTKLLRVALIEQLKALRSRGASLHFELSGVASGDILAKLADICQHAGIRHISTNREELVQITSEFGSPYFVAPRPIVPEGPFTIYWRAEHLLKKLGLDTYYVHDLELNMVVRRNHPGEARAAAVGALERHRQALLLAKAAVPEALIRRAGVDQTWDLMLSTQSLVALLAFANEYADSVSVMVKGIQRDTVLEQILRTGYYHHPDEEGASIVVTPTVFVDFAQGVGIAGAGDMDVATYISTL